MKQLRMYLLAISATVVVGLFGCAGGETGGGDPAVDTTSGSEIATGDGLPELDVVAGIDTGSGLDTSSRGDDTGSFGDGSPPDDAIPTDTAAGGAAISGSADDSAQRGPVVVRYDVQLDSAASYVVSASWRLQEGEPFQPCTPLKGYGDLESDAAAVEGHGRYVWDSMADLQEDVGSVELQLEVLASDGAAGTGHVEPFPLYNDPTRVRQVLLTHDINGDNRVRQLTWTHGVGLGGVGGDPAGLIHTIGPTPRRVTFSPNGIRAVIIEEGNGTLRFLQFDHENGSIGGNFAELIPDLYPVDVEFSGDGGDLYIVHSSPNPDGGVYRVPLDTNGGGFLGFETPQQIHSQYVPGDLEVLPDGRGLALLAADPEGDMNGMHLVILSLDGDVLSETSIGPEGSIARNVAASPDGQWLLATYFNLFAEGEDRVVLLALDPEGNATIVNDVEVSDPEEPAWTADSLTALVTEAMNDKVTGLAVEGGDLIKGSSFTLGLASRVAHTRWGPDSDIFLVTTVSPSTGKSGLAVVTVGEGGTVTNTGTYELGNGIDKIPGDVAIQP